MLTDAPALMLVTNRHAAKMPLPDLAAAAAAGGVDIIQVREKDLQPDQLLTEVKAVVDAVPASAAVVVNSSVAVAAATGTGLHLPDVSRALADRSALADGALFGLSVHGVTGLPEPDAFDYLIAGHLFLTSSKPRQMPLGIDGLASVCQRTSTPVLAIGGITPANAHLALSTGALGIAVMSGINDADDPNLAAMQYRKALDASMRDHTSEESVETIVNGKPMHVPAGTSVVEFLHNRGQHERLVVVERNGTILRKADLESTRIEHGDVLEIVHFVGGG